MGVMALAVLGVSVYDAAASVRRGGPFGFGERRAPALLREEFQSKFLPDNLEEEFRKIMPEEVAASAAKEKEADERHKKMIKEIMSDPIRQQKVKETGIDPEAIIEETRKKVEAIGMFPKPNISAWRHGKDEMTDYDYFVQEMMPSRIARKQRALHRIFEERYKREKLIAEGKLDIYNEPVHPLIKKNWMEPGEKEPRDGVHYLPPPINFKPLGDEEGDLFNGMTEEQVMALNPDIMPDTDDREQYIPWATMENTKKWTKGLREFSDRLQAYVDDPKNNVTDYDAIRNKNWPVWVSKPETWNDARRRGEETSSKTDGSQDELNQPLRFEGERRQKPEEALGDKEAFNREVRELMDE